MLVNSNESSVNNTEIYFHIIIGMHIDQKSIEKKINNNNDQVDREQGNMFLRNF